ncbi:MAG: DUF2249 domain-containing protein [Rubrivivax sp.]|nr:DUF2249 domain-containing protein [Rubrivivax sp.]
MTPTVVDPITSTIDIRAVAPRERHALIFTRFDALRPGQALQLVRDHDPQPLRYQLEDRSYGQFEWTYLEAGPDLWRVQIGKPAAAANGTTRPVGDSCCSGGACCG